MINADAICKKCGYSLKGQSEFRCPECGRTFNPSKPCTYDTPVKRRVRIVVKVLVIVSAIASFFIFVCPTRLLALKADWRCSLCSERHEVKRWEPAQREWLRGFIPRWPGYTRITQRPSAGCNHSFDTLSIRYESPLVLSSNGSVNCSPTDDVIINDAVTNPENSALMLYELSAPHNDGISLTCRTKPPTQ